MRYIEHETSDLFVLSQKVLGCLLGEIQQIPKRVGITIFVEPSCFVDGLQRQVEANLAEVIAADRRLSSLEGVGIKVTIKSANFAKPNVIGLMFQLDGK